MGNHRVLEWVGLGGTVKTILFHPLSWTGMPSTRPSPIQARLKHFHGWGSHSFSGSKPHCLRSDMHGTGALGALSLGEFESTVLVNYSPFLNNLFEDLEYGHP